MGTDRGHLALLCQLLQLVGLVLCFYESLLHVFQRLGRHTGRAVGGLARRERSRDIPALKTVPGSSYLVKAVVQRQRVVS